MWLMSSLIWVVLAIGIAGMVILVQSPKIADTTEGVSTPVL